MAIIVSNQEAELARFAALQGTQQEIRSCLYLQCMRYPILSLTCADGEIDCGKADYEYQSKDKREVVASVLHQQKHLSTPQRVTVIHGSSVSALGFCRQGSM